MRSLTVFLVLTFSVSSIFYAWSYSGAPLGQVAPFLMWTPGLAAIVTQFIFHRTLGGLGWHPGPWRYLAWGFVLPFVYCLAIYVPVWASGFERFDGTYVAGPLSLLPLFMALSVFTALGEEIGWRGSSGTGPLSFPRLRMGGRRHRDHLGTLARAADRLWRLRRRHAAVVRRRLFHDLGAGHPTTCLFPRD